MPGTGRAQPGEAESRGKAGSGRGTRPKASSPLPCAKCHRAAEGTRAVTRPGQVEHPEILPCLSFPTRKGGWGGGSGYEDASGRVTKAEELGDAA